MSGSSNHYDSLETRDPAAREADLFARLPNVLRDSIPPFMPPASAPALFAMAATRAFSERGWTREDLARVAVKNHANGAKHPKAHFRREITMETAYTRAK